MARPKHCKIIFLSLFLSSCSVFDSASGTLEEVKKIAVEIKDTVQVTKEALSEPIPEEIKAGGITAIGLFILNLWRNRTRERRLARESGSDSAKSGGGWPVS